MDIAKLAPLHAGIVRWRSSSPHTSVVVKLTFSVAQDGALQLAKQQRPLEAGSGNSSHFYAQSPTPSQQIALVEGTPARRVTMPQLQPFVFYADSLQRGRVRQLELSCDTLVIDGSQQHCTLCWRGEIANPTGDDGEHLVIGVSAADAAPQWSELLPQLQNAEWSQAVVHDAAPPVPKERIQVTQTMTGRAGLTPLPFDADAAALPPNPPLHRRAGTTVFHSDQLANKPLPFADEAAASPPATLLEDPLPPLVSERQAFTQAYEPVVPQVATPFVDGATIAPADSGETSALQSPQPATEPPQQRIVLPPPRVAEVAQHSAQWVAHVDPLAAQQPPITVVPETVPPEADSPTETDPVVTVAPLETLPEEDYARIRAALDEDEENLSEVLASAAVELDDWNATVRRLEKKTADEMRAGHDSLARHVRSLVAKARAKQHGSKALANGATVEEYAALRAEVEECNDAATLLEELGLNDEDWRSLRGIWSRLCLHDRQLAVRFKTEIERARREIHRSRPML